MTGPAREEIRSVFTSTTGGVMTEEAGAVTGEIELLCRPGEDGLHVAARYAGTEAWYTVSGSPVRPLDDPESVSRQVVEHLSMPGPVVDGNEQAATLEDFPEA